MPDAMCFSFSGINIIEMKNICIIFQKHKESTENCNEKEAESGIRRSVNSLCAKAMQKDLPQRLGKGDNLRIKTARPEDNPKSRNVISSLSISSIGRSQQLVRCSTGLDKRPHAPESVFNIRKKKESRRFFSLGLPVPETIQAQTLMRRRSSKKIEKKAGVKLLTKIRC